MKILAFMQDSNLDVNCTSSFYTILQARNGLSRTLQKPRSNPCSLMSVDVSGPDLHHFDSYVRLQHTNCKAGMTYVKPSLQY